MMKYISVAIDGPSGAGKSTVARAAAAKLGYVYVLSLIHILRRLRC